MNFVAGSIAKRWKLVQASLIVGVLILAGLTQPARATVVISTLSDSQSGLIGLASGQLYGYSFTTGSNALGYSLTDVVVSEFLHGANQLNFGIYTDSSGNPNLSSAMPLQQLTFGTGNVNVVYASSTPLVLAANTTYWLGITGTASTNGFYDTFDTAYTSNNGWVFHPGTTYTSNSGATWQTYAPSLVFAIDATTIPEPSTWVMLALGCAVMWGVRRKLRA